MDRRVKVLAQADQICRLFMTAPGVGYIAALTFKSAVDDPSRFKRSKTVAAHFGLTPRRYQSGERDRVVSPRLGTPKFARRFMRRPISS